MSKYRIDVANSDDPYDNYSLIHDEEFLRGGGSEFFKIFMVRGSGTHREAIEKSEWDKAAAQAGKLEPVWPNSDFGSGALIDLREKTGA